MQKRFMELTVVGMILATALGLAAQQPQAQPPQAQPGAGPQAKPAEEWHTVGKGPIKVEVDFEGVFEAVAGTPVELKFKAFQSQGLKVVEAVAQGTTVNAGDLILKLDTEDIDKAIRDAEMADAAGNLSLQIAEKEFELSKKSLELDKLAAERAYKRAQEDYDRYVKIDKPYSEKSVYENHKRVNDQVEYAQEELRQLEKMYKEDDLTEETEEIILKRQKRAVESALMMKEGNENMFQANLKFLMPRKNEDMAASIEGARIAYERATAGFPLKELQALQANTKAKLAYEETAKKLAELKADRELLTVKAPAAGVMFYGKAEKGKWQDVAAVAAGMKKDGTIRPGVVMTIVGSKQLQVRFDATEANITKIAVGQSAWVTPTINPFSPLAAKLQSVASIPVGTYDVVAALDDATDTTGILPGMTCRVKVLSYEKADAVKVPLSAVKSDSPGKYHVMAKTVEGGTEKREVKIGRRTGDEAEVLEGVKEGDQVKKN